MEFWTVWRKRGWWCAASAERMPGRRLITLTEKGSQQQALFQRHFQEAEQQMVRGFTAEEQEILRTLLSRVIRNLEEDETR